MARINVEDSWWVDTRRTKLIKLLGSERLADGAALALWRLAQDYWKKKSGPKNIPLHVFEQFEGYEAFVECGLVEVDRTLSEAIVRGASEHFEWLLKSREDGKKGGRASAEKRKKKYGSAQPNSIKAKNPRTPPEPFSTHAETSSSISISSSSSISSSNSSCINIAKKTSNVNAWEIYRKVYLERYGVDPVRNVKVNSQLKQLVERLGSDSVEKVITFYLNHNGSRYVANAHSVGVMLMDAEKLHTECIRGSVIQSNRQSDVSNWNQSLIKKIDRGEI